MSNLLDKLYVTNMPEFQRGGRLRPLLHVVLATNIKNFNAKYSVLGANNRAIQRIIQHAEVCGIGYEKLNEMSSIMENDFRLRNTVTVDGGVSLEVMLQKSIEMNEIFCLRCQIFKPPFALSTNELRILRPVWKSCRIRVGICNRLHKQYLIHPLLNISESLLQKKSRIETCVPVMSPVVPLPCQHSK